MSRLERHKQKQFIAQLVFYVLLLCLIVVFIFTVGISFLFRTALFIANFSTKKVAPAPLTKNNDFIGQIDVTDIPTATNSARFVIGGSLLNFDKLVFFINDEKVKETALTDSDRFSEEIGDLKKGVNKVYIVAASQKENEKKTSKTYEIYYTSDKPRLDLKSPGDNSKTNKQEITVTGQTDREIFVKLNGVPLVVDAQGIFQTGVRLHDGENKIVFTAQDVAGNSETKTLTVIFQKD
ncbi:hypothetical protein HY214_01000 [Candidatus Roizmanbacteria bacterium]|nr:hypothetical protein [Candidatus Roizmanbacteria bacterium]